MSFFCTKESQLAQRRAWVAGGPWRAGLLRGTLGFGLPVFLLLLLWDAATGTGITPQRILIGLPLWAAVGFLFGLTLYHRFRRSLRQHDRSA